MNTFTVRYTASGTQKSATENNEDLEFCAREENNRYTVTLRAKKEIRLLLYAQSSTLRTNKDDLYFLNGYQSWTDTKEFLPAERERDVNRLPRFLVDAFAFDRYGDASFYAYGKRLLHGYDVFYCKGEQEKFILNFNYSRAYLLIELDLKNQSLNLSYDYNEYKIDAGTEITVADYYLSDSVSEGMQNFNKVFPLKNTPKIFGYTSWYNYYQNITEEILLRDLDALDERFDLFQIDDGYEIKVGDWLTVDAKKFPHGLKLIADAAHQKGLKAGIWLAPFVAEAESQLFKTRKDIFLRDEAGEFVKCGANWSGFYALDPENPDARSYIKKCLRFYADMGFDFFKLDFLYAANLVTKEGTSRSMAAESAYTFLRECLGDKIILGCGATVFNCIGKFDYLRVGPDVSLIFDDVWYMRYMHRERISTKVTLQNTIYRSFFNDRLFGNDPDVFLLRDDNLKLSEKQRRALLTLNALFGNVLMTSDNLNNYDENKRKLLADALDLFHRARVTDYARETNTIKITYTIDGQSQTIRYDTKRGILC